MRKEKMSEENGNHATTMLVHHRDVSQSHVLSSSLARFTRFARSALPIFVPYYIRYVIYNIAHIHTQIKGARR